MLRRFIACFIIILLISCSEDESSLNLSVGHNFIKSQSTIAVIDTFSVKLSTVLIDSIPTSNSEILMVGSYNDDELGKVSSTGFFQIGLPETIEVHDKAVFDSLTVVLKYTGDSYGDTLQPQTINVCRALEEIEENDDSYLYNTSFFNYDETPIGTLTFYPKPNFYEEVEVRLSDELGEEFMDLMKTNSDEFSSADEFLDYFKGIAIEPGTSNTSVLAFNAADSLINVILYTHYVKEEKTEVKYEFPLNSTSTCFNHIEADRTGTSIENLETQKDEIPSSESGGRSYIQAGTGIVTRVDIPSLGKLLELDVNNILYKAELIFKPYPLSCNSIDLPEEIIFYTTDKYNRMLSEIVTDEGYSIYADLYKDDLYNEYTYYSFDITEFIMDELTDSYFDPDNGLLIVMPEDKFQGSLERLVIDARTHVSYKPILKMYLIFYD